MQIEHYTKTACILNEAFCEISCNYVRKECVIIIHYINGYA